MEAERVFCAHKLCKPLASSFCDLLGGRVQCGQCGQYDSFLTLVLSGNSWNSGSSVSWSKPLFQLVLAGAKKVWLDEYKNLRKVKKIFAKGYKIKYTDSSGDLPEIDGLPALLTD